MADTKLNGRLVALLLSALVPTGFAAAASVPAGTVRVDGGELQGTRSNSLYAFLGVPYAASTADNNRWREPQPLAHWSGVRDATRFGADCPQDAPYSPAGGSPWTAEYLTQNSTSEDCLLLNVWTASLRADAKLPVMVWIHGGGFGGGSGAVPIYNGASLAARGIVVVTINYRLGVLGFMALPELTVEAGSSGNYGIQDQIAALQWLRRNVAQFGGDPERITIAGQSAGAESVRDLIAAPSAKGLFIRAILESDPHLGPRAQALAAAEAQGQRIAAAAQARSLAELRAMPLRELIAAANDPSVGPPGIRFRPIPDPQLLPDPYQAVSTVPVLIGLNADEASAGGGDWSTGTVVDLRSLLERRFGQHADRFAALYPARDSGQARRAARAVLREQGIATLLAWSDARPRNAPPMYGYLFDWQEPGADGGRFGAFHSSEIPYVFETLNAAPRPFTALDRRLSAQLASYWSNFVKTGDPNGAKLPRWAVLATGKLMVLGAHSGSRPALSEAKRRAYEDFLAAGGTLGIF